MLDEETLGQFYRVEEFLNELREELNICGSDPTKLSIRGRVVSQDIVEKISNILDQLFYLIWVKYKKLASIEIPIKPSPGFPDIKNGEEFKKNFLFSTKMKKCYFSDFLERFPLLKEYLLKKRANWITEVKNFASDKHRRIFSQESTDSDAELSSKSFTNVMGTGGSQRNIKVSTDTSSNTTKCDFANSKYLTSPLEFHENTIKECRKMVEEMFEKFL